MDKIFNIVNALSNYPVLNVIHTSLKRQDYVTASIGIFIGIASPLSHIAEKHKHGLPGVFNITKHQSYLLNRLDVLGATMTFARAIYLYYINYGCSLDYFANNPTFTGLLLVAGAMNLISEKIPYIANDHLLYTITHSTWHILIFTLLNTFLINIYYTQLLIQHGIY